MQFLNNLITYANTMSLYSYWVPLFVCSVVYMFRIVNFYKFDLEQCTKSYYTPKLTISKIVWYIFLSTVPVVNLFAFVFDSLGSVLGWLTRVLDIPLVRSQYVKKD